MRRSLSIIAAAVIAVGASIASSAPAEAAKLMRLPAAAAPAQVGTIMEVNSPGHGDRHSAFRDDGWNDGWRYNRRNRYRQHGNFRRHQPFYFGFPFAFVQPYRYTRRQDCFRTWEGYVVCR
jgi:hypothetical protein